MEYKQQFIDIPNDQDNREDEKSLKFAYVTFKSMDDVDTVQKAYKISKCDRCCIRVCKKDMIPSLNSKFLF